MAEVVFVGLTPSSVVTLAADARRPACRSVYGVRSGTSLSKLKKRCRSNYFENGNTLWAVKNFKADPLS